MRVKVWLSVLIGTVLTVVGASPLLAASTAAAVATTGGDTFFWYLSRVAGLTGYLLLFLSVCLGVSIHTRFLEWLLKGWQNFDLHQFTSLLGLGFVVLHIFSLLGDHYVGLTLQQLLVPFAASYQPVWLAVGTIAFYLLVIVTVSFYVRSFIGQKTWRALHFVTFAIFFMALLHGLFAGSDSESWAKVLYWLTAVIVTVLTIGRMWDAGAAKPGSASTKAGEDGALRPVQRGAGPATSGRAVEGANP